MLIVNLLVIKLKIVVDLVERKSEVCCRGTIPSNNITSEEESRRSATVRPTEAIAIATTNY